MTTYPGAILKLIPPGTNDPRIQPVGVVLHVAVSESDSLYSWFNGPSGGIESHMYVRRDGRVEQYRDFEHEADAQFKGNSWLAGAHRNGFISIETQGLANGEWTSEQLDTIEAICRWLSERYGFPLRKVPTMQPDSPAKGGIGYHTQFVGWSNVAGKVCPGPDRIAQFHDTLLPRLQEDPVTDADIDKIATAVKDKLIGSAGLVNDVRVGVQAELGDENAGAFSDRVAAKVLAGLPTAGAPVDVASVVSATVTATIDALFPLKVVKG